MEENLGKANQPVSNKQENAVFHEPWVANTHFLIGNLQYLEETFSILVMCCGHICL